MSGTFVDRRTVVDGKIRRLSVSQVTIFDPRQYGGCNRRWWFRYVAGIKEPDSAAQQRGTEIHDQIRHYLTTGEDVLPIIVRVGKHFLPEPGADLLVEHAFNEANQILTADGIPFVGAIDVAHRRGTYVNNEGIVRTDTPTTAEVIDHKSSSDVAQYAKRGDQLIETVQMVGYGIVASKLWPDIDMVRLSHNYFQTRGARYAEKKTALFPLVTVKDKWQDVETTVRTMRDVASETDGQKVPPAWDSCNAYKGCPHRARCPRSPEQAIVDLFGKGNAMSLLNRRGNAGAAGASSGTLASAGIGPAATPGASAVDAEVARLKLEEERLRAAQTAPPAVVNYGVFCPQCGTGLTSANASKLADNTVRHIGCAKAPAAVSPPDAPASDPARAAVAVPPESIPTLPPAVQAAAVAHTQHNAAPVSVTSAATTPPAAEAPKSTRRRATPKPAATPPPATDAAPSQLPAGTTPSATTAERAAAEGIDLHLLVDVHAVGVGVVRDLMEYVQPLCDELCELYKAADIRCAPNDSPLAFSKWKGALAALIRERLPENGVYAVDNFYGCEIKQVAVETLRPICATFIRGVR